MKTRTYSALSHFNFETRHGAHESSTLDLLGGVSEAVPAAGPGEARDGIYRVVHRQEGIPKWTRRGKKGDKFLDDGAPQLSSREGFPYPAHSAPPKVWAVSVSGVGLGK